MAWSFSAADPADRPSGVVAPEVPLDGVTEIRVHGVGGTAPTTLLDDPSPQQVSGDRIAGFYRTSDRQGRHIEAYSWGGLTSRSRFRVLWLLLVPFMLANVAGWMAEPRTPVKAGKEKDGTGAGDNDTGAGDKESGWQVRVTAARNRLCDDGAPTSFAYRWVARLAALAVTGNILGIITLGTLDVVAYQCGGMPACTSQGWWLSPLTWDSLADHPSRRILIGALLACAAILVLALLSYASRRRYENIEPPTVGETHTEPEVTAAALPNGLQNANFWAGKLAHARLSRLHLAFAITTVALIVTYCSDAATVQSGVTQHVATIAWPATWIIGIAVLIAVVLFVGLDPLKQWVSAAVVAGSLACFAGASWFAWVQPAQQTEPGHLPGLRIAMLNSWATTLVLMSPLLLWPVLQLVYRRMRGLGRRPYSHHFGWGAPFVVAVTGMIVADIVLLALIVVLANFLGTIEWAAMPPVGATGAGDPIYLYPAMSLAITLIMVVSGVIVISAALYGVVGYLRAGDMADATRVRRGLVEEYDDRPESHQPRGRTPAAWQASALWQAPDEDHAFPTPKLGNFVRSVARWRHLAGITTRIPYVLTILVTVAVILILLIHMGAIGWITSDIAILTPLMITAAALVPPAILAFMWRSWSRVENRKAIGVLWDVGTFWPRSFHPFAPPSYAERAVPELLRRIWWLHDNKGRVLLAGHSQGSMLSTAALLRQSGRKSGEREVALVTFGAPVKKLYRWAFPAYLNDAVLENLAKGAGGIGDVCWRNFYYRTDVIGGPVLPDCLETKPDAEWNDVDTVLSDPPRSRYIFGQPEPEVGGHSGYWHDKTMWKRVDDLAGQLATAGPSTLIHTDWHRGLVTAQPSTPKEPGRPNEEIRVIITDRPRTTRGRQSLGSFIATLHLLLLRLWTEKSNLGRRGVRRAAGHRE